MINHFLDEFEELMNFPNFGLGIIFVCIFEASIFTSSKLILTSFCSLHFTHADNMVVVSPTDFALMLINK